MPTNNAPRNVLPTSPIKSLDSPQLKNKKPKRHAITGIIFIFKYIEVIKNTIIIQLANKQSNPSKKLMKLIITNEKIL